MQPPDRQPSRGSPRTPSASNWEIALSVDGNFSGLRTVRGALIEYTEAPDPLALFFDFNPSSMTRTRAVTIRTGDAAGTTGGYDFASKSEVPRASQGVSTQPESLSAKILLDATDRMNAGDPVAATVGVQPEIDILRTMVEPKSQTPEGARTLAALGEGDGRAFSRDRYASVLLFQWGAISLPVFMTQAQVELRELLPNLFPYRAEATLALQVIESSNPIYTTELKRQTTSATSRVLTLGGNNPL